MIFEFRHAVRDNARPGLHIGFAVFDNQRPQRDACIHVAAVVEVSNGTRVGAAPVRFQLVDDLHRADLRCAGDRAGGKRCFQSVERVLAVSQHARDVRGDVHHVAVAFDDHHVRQFDAPILCHTSNVVASQVDEHHVLGPFLGIGEQFFGQPFVFFVVVSARPGARQRSYRDDTIHHAAHDLRRAADECHGGRTHKKHERTGIHDSQRSIDLKRIGVNVDLQPLADHDLKNIARSDVFDTLSYGVLEVRLLKVGSVRNLRDAPRIDIRDRQRVGGGRKLRNHAIDPALRILEGRFRIAAVFVQMSHRDHKHGLADVVEDGHVIVEAKAQIRQPAIVLGCVWQMLRVTNHVVTRIADRSTSEWRQLWKMSGLESSEPLANFFERVGCFVLLALVLGNQRDKVSRGAQFQERIGRQEAISAHLLAADHALEKTRTSSAIDTVKRGHRGQGITKQAPPDRNQAMFAA